MAAEGRFLSLAGIAAVLAVSSQAPAEAALADPANRPIARINQIRTQLLETSDVKVVDTAGAVVAQWSNWRKF